MGAIVLYAMVGTLASTFVVGMGCFYLGRMGILATVNPDNPMEALLFGSLISAVDPVATLSIMGNAELRCDPLLYSLVFGESVLNDAVAISLFRAFAQYYQDPNENMKIDDTNSSNDVKIVPALASFLSVSIGSVLLGVVLGLLPSFLFKQVPQLSQYPHLELALLCCFCYASYAVTEALSLSGIMALFFQGITLSHYNSYNLSNTALVASEQLFATLAVLAETVVFLYMGLDVVEKFQGTPWSDWWFAVVALVLCIVGRFCNIFPLSWIANRCRRRQGKSGEMADKNSERTKSVSSADESEDPDYSGARYISLPMQCVLWFAGLRGAIAFALAVNMPGPNREGYATATLFICLFTTIVCGGLTNPVLNYFGMKIVASSSGYGTKGASSTGNSKSGTRQSATRPSVDGNDSQLPMIFRTRQHVYKGFKRVVKRVDSDVLVPMFGGASGIISYSASSDDSQKYPLHSNVGSDQRPYKELSFDDDHDDFLHGELGSLELTETTRFQRQQQGDVVILGGLQGN